MSLQEVACQRTERPQDVIFSTWLDLLQSSMAGWGGDYAVQVY